MLTKGAIGNLVNRYKAVLKKCHLINTFGSLAVASMLVMGAAGVAQASAPTLFEDLPSSGLTEVITDPNLYHERDTTTDDKIHISGTSAGASASSAVTAGINHSTAINNGSIWVTASENGGYAEGMGNKDNISVNLINEGKIFVDGTTISATKGMGTNPGGKATNEGLIAVKNGSAMADNSGSSQKSLINNGTISVEDANGVGIYYRKEAITDGEVTNNGTIYASNGGIGVLMSNDKEDDTYNDKLFTNTGNILADENSTAILVAGTDGATVALKDKSHVEGLIALMGTNNKLTVSNVGETAPENLYVKGVFSGSVTGSNIVFTENSDVTLGNAFSIDKDSTVSMSNVTLAQGQAAADKGFIVIDANGTTLNGGQNFGNNAKADIEHVDVNNSATTMTGIDISDVDVTKDDGSTSGVNKISGGITAVLENGRKLTIADSNLYNNKITLKGIDNGGFPDGALLRVDSIDDSSTLSIKNTHFDNNTYISGHSWCSLERYLWRHCRRW